MVNKQKLMIASDTIDQSVNHQVIDTSSPLSHVIALDSTVSGWDSLSGQPIKIIINLDNNFSDATSDLNKTNDKMKVF